MIYLSLSEFLKLPAGTIYSDYQPEIVGHYEPPICRGLYRKGNTIYREGVAPIDFFYASLIAKSINEAKPTIDTIEERWDEEKEWAMFAVYEESDLAVLRSMLPSP